MGIIIMLTPIPPEARTRESLGGMKGFEREIQRTRERARESVGG